MSTGDRIPLAVAVQAAAWLAGAWGGGLEVVGSVRRGRRDVGDIEFVAPVVHPQEQTLLAPEIRDTLHDAVAAAEYVTPVKGLKPGFYHCSLDVRGRRGTHRVEIFRYDPGPAGNRGWIQLLRTGPEDFGVAFLQRWHSWLQLPDGQKTSDDGYLRDAGGRPCSAPDEESCFRLAGLQFVPPEHRLGPINIVPLRSVA